MRPRARSGILSLTGPEAVRRRDATRMVTASRGDRTSAARSPCALVAERHRRAPHVRRTRTLPRGDGVPSSALTCPPPDVSGVFADASHGHQTEYRFWTARENEDEKRPRSSFDAPERPRSRNESVVTATPPSCDIATRRTRCCVSCPPEPSVTSNEPSAAYRAANNAQANDKKRRMSSVRQPNDGRLIAWLPMKEWFDTLVMAAGKLKRAVRSSPSVAP